MIEKVLFAVKIGEADWKEVMLTNKEERFEDAQKWGKENGFDRFRIAEIDITKKPDFTKTIK